MCIVGRSRLQGSRDTLVLCSVVADLLTDLCTTKSLSLDYALYAKHGVGTIMTHYVIHCVCHVIKEQ